MLTLLAALLAAQSAVEAPVRPVPRGDRNSQIAHEQLVEKARRGGIDIYFEGDSITRRWGTSEAQYREFLDNWRRNFFGWRLEPKSPVMLAAVSALARYWSAHPQVQSMLEVAREHDDPEIRLAAKMRYA